MMPSKIEVFAAVLAVSACGPIDAPLDDEAGDVEASDAQDAVASTSSELRTCYCAQPYACLSSSSASHMYSEARAALARAGVSVYDITQSYGDAPASVGTHCPERGTTYSAATDLSPGSSPCARVHALRMQGFAAWYRSPPSFGYHIHAVYAGTPVRKQSLTNQLDQFLQGLKGLATERYEGTCPITEAEKSAVRRVRAGGSVSGGSSGGSASGSCFSGGYYCGGDRVSGAASNLYRCNSDGRSASFVRTCARGCSVNSGTNDSCRCAAGSAYCGTDVVNGDRNTLYRCGSDGVSTSVIRVCANGCSINPGASDSCK